MNVKQFKRLQNDLLKRIKIELPKSGPLAVIINNNDPKYYMVRASEAIHSAMQNPENAQQNIELALKLLILTEVHNAATKEIQSQEGTGSDNPGKDS